MRSDSLRIALGLFYPRIPEQFLILYSRTITFTARERVCLSAQRELSVRSAENVIGREYKFIYD